MKKLILKLCFAVMAVAFMSGAALAEFNLRLTLDTPGTFTMKGTNSIDYDVDFSATFSGDFMKRVAGQYLKLGGGFEIPSPRKFSYKSHSSNDPIWYLPLYFSVQTNPVPNAGLFFKLNIGYNLFFLNTNWDASYRSNFSYNGGLYYAFAAGYEFPFGLIADVTYAVYNGTLKYTHYYTPVSFDETYKKVGVSIGYKVGRERR